MNPTAIYSKSGKGVQEASGKTSLLQRGDRAVLAKAREEAEAKAAAEREKLKKEAEAKARAEMEAKVRAEAEDKVKEAAAARAKAEAEAKAKTAQEAAARAAAEAKAKAEAEARAKIEAQAKAKLEAERKAREELERKLEAERKAREEAERKAKAEAERKAKEAEEKARREAEVPRQRLEAERMAREAAERKAKQEAEAKAKLEAERKREEERRREEEERKQREEEDAAKLEAERAAAAAAAAMANVAAAPGPGDGVTKKAKKKDNFADSLLADLESFTSDDEGQKAQEEADRPSKAEADRARAEVERKIKEEAERQRQAEEEERRLAEEARRAREEEERRAEEEERRAQEEERRRRDAEEIRRKAEAATAAAMAAEGKKHEPKEEDIPVTEDDADMAEVEREREEAERAKAQAKKREKEKARAEKEKAASVPRRPRRPIKWGKPVSVTAALVLVIGVGAAHIVSLDATQYERAASTALGRPVKVGSANLWLFSGLPQMRFNNVRVGDARITRVIASGWPGGLFGERKEFSNVRIEGLSLPQEAIGDALFARVRGDNFSVSSITVKNLQLPGPATLPKDLVAEATLDARGALRAAKVEGPDGLLAKLTPKQDGSIDFEVIAGGFTLPIAPQVTLSKFVMRGIATPRGMTITEWGGALFQGGISGKANVRWSGSWTVDGVITARNINAAVFAPALLSSGNADGTAKFSMNAADPAGLVAGSRLDATFTVNKGTLGSFDLARYIQSGGRQGAGTTQFAEMNGQATYDRGSVLLRNVNIGAGRLNAGASADIASSGALSGRIVADMRTEKETQRVTLIIGGTVKEPQVRN